MIQTPWNHREHALLDWQSRGKLYLYIFDYYAWFLIECHRHWILPVCETNKLQNATSLPKFLCCFSSFLTKLPCTQYAPIIIWRLHLLHPWSSKYYWALRRPLNKQEKASLQVTCLICRLPARVLSSAWGPCWLEGCSRRGVVGRRSSVWAFIAGRHAPHRSGCVSSRLGRLHGVTVQKQGRYKSNTFLARMWAHCERVCEMVVWFPSALVQQSSIHCHHWCSDDHPKPTPCKAWKKKDRAQVLENMRGKPAKRYILLKNPLSCVLTSENEYSEDETVVIPDTFLRCFSKKRAHG